MGAVNLQEDIGRLPSILSTLTDQGFERCSLRVDPPAEPGAVEETERTLGLVLPSSFRQVLTDIAGGLAFEWSAPPGPGFPDPFLEVGSGQLFWSLEALPYLAGQGRDWINAQFDDPDDPYDRVWHDKLPIVEVGNGDYIALDLTPERHGNVVYLSHDYGQGHGLTMAASFQDLIHRWVPLACPGPEEWQWLPFHSAASGGIDPTTEMARRWISLLAPNENPPLA